MDTIPNVLKQKANYLPGRRQNIFHVANANSVHANNVHVILRAYSVRQTIASLVFPGNRGSFAKEVS